MVLRRTEAEESGRRHDQSRQNGSGSDGGTAEGTGKALAGLGEQFFPHLNCAADAQQSL